MSYFLKNVFNWITGKPDVPKGRLDTAKFPLADNNLLISCIFDRTLEIKYLDGVVTKMLDVDICLINNQYHYKPQTEDEIRNFSLIRINSCVRVAIYKKKYLNRPWTVASCILSDPVIHEPPEIIETTAVLAPSNDNETTNRQTFEIVEFNRSTIKSFISGKVLGGEIKIIDIGQELTIKIVLKNNSYIKDEELLDYKTIAVNNEQLLITKKQKLPITIRRRSEHIVDIVIKGTLAGRSKEKVEFYFRDITCNVDVNVSVIEPTISYSQNPRYPIDKQKIDLLRTTGMMGSNNVPEKVIRMTCSFKKMRKWNIPLRLEKCFQDEHGNYITYAEMSAVKDNIEKLYPFILNNLTYKRYKSMFHFILFMDEIENAIALQRYAQERKTFVRNEEFLVLKMVDLAEQHTSLSLGDRVSVKTVPNCTLAGDNRKYDGIIHKILTDEIWLKFDSPFYIRCDRYYSVNFFSFKKKYRQLHTMIETVYTNSPLNESILFPNNNGLKYQPPKLEIVDDNEINETLSSTDNLHCSENNFDDLPRPGIIKKIRWDNNTSRCDKLNFEQKSAVINILKGEARSIPYIIYGPPGTGKTSTLAESIIQVYKELPSSKLLVCASTNPAIDVLLSKILNSGLFDKNIIKRLIGFSHFQSSSYNKDYDEYCYVVNDNNINISEVLASKFIKKNDIFKLQIVITTIDIAGLLSMMNFNKGHFSHIFVDEAGHLTEPEILIPLSFLDPLTDGQFVLAGDLKQLGPVILSRLGQTYGLGQSMLSRIIDCKPYKQNFLVFPEYNGYNPKVMTYLIQNYRSLPEIVHNFSTLFYDSLLKSTNFETDSPERKLLRNLNENSFWDIECKGPIIVHGITGVKNRDPSKVSWINSYEAYQVTLYVTRILKTGISTDEIGIITPYHSQIKEIKMLLKMYHPDITLPKVGTVEMFQGQQKSIIIISMVKNNYDIGHKKDIEFNIGLINNPSRTNVALSRAKALLIIIANPATMQMSPEWNYVLSNAVKNENYIGCNISDEGLKN